MGYHRYDLVMRACIFANRNHCGQTRYNKDKGPVMEHITEVALLVKDAGGTDIEVASAFLHDTIEDTSATNEEIISIFGYAIADIVDGLTDPPEFNGLPLVERKALQAQRIQSKSRSVKLIKIADQVSNVFAVAVDPPEKWDHKKCLEYVEGAYQIVNECRGINGYLFRKFAEAYSLARKAHQ